MHTSAKVDSVSAPSNLTKGIAAIKAKNYQSAIECLLAEVKSIQLATKDAKGDIYKSLNPHYRLLSLAYAELAMQPAEDRIENLKRSIEMMNNVTPLAEADKARITLLQKTLDAVTQNQRLASQLLSMPSPSVEKKPDVGNKVKSSSNVPAPVKIKPKKKKVVFTKEPESSSTIDFSSKKELENIQSEKNKLEKEITRLFKEIEDNLKVIDAHSQSKYSKTYSEKSKNKDNFKITKIKEAYTYIEKDNCYTYKTSENNIDELKKANVKITGDIAVLNSINSDLAKVIYSIETSKENNKISPKARADEKPLVAKSSSGNNAKGSKLQEKREQQKAHAEKRRLEKEQEKREKELELKRKQEAEKLLEAKRKQKAEEERKLELFKKQKQAELKEKELAAERERFEKEQALERQKKQEEIKKKQAEQELENKKKLEEERKALEKAKEEKERQRKIELLTATVEKEGQRIKEEKELAEKKRLEGEPIEGEKESAEHKRLEGEPIKGEGEADQKRLADEKNKKETKQAMHGHAERAVLHLSQVRECLNLSRDMGENIKYYAILYHLTIVFQNLTIFYALNNVSSDKSQYDVLGIAELVISRLVNVDFYEDQSNANYKDILSAISRIQTFGSVEKRHLFQKITAFFKNEKSLNQENVFNVHFYMLKEIFNKINPSYLSAGEIIGHIQKQYPNYLAAIKILVIILGESSDNIKSHKNISAEYSSLVEKVSCLLRPHNDTEIQHIFEFCKLLKINHDNENNVSPRGFFANSGVIVGASVPGTMPIRQQLVHNKRSRPRGRVANNAVASTAVPGTTPIRQQLVHNKK